LVEQPVKNWVLILLVVTIWLEICTSYTYSIAPVVTTASVILSSNKIQNGDILITANPGPPGKWPLKYSVVLHIGLVFQRRTFSDCWCKMFYRLDGLPVTQPTVSREGKTVTWEHLRADCTNTMYHRFWLVDVVDVLCGSWLFISCASHNVKRIPMQSAYDSSNVKGS